MFTILHICKIYIAIYTHLSRASRRRTNNNTINTLNLKKL